MNYNSRLSKPIQYFLAFLILFINISFGSDMNIEEEKPMNKYFGTIKNLTDWKELLASPNTQWKSGYSAKELAISWFNSNGFPNDIQKIFKKSNNEILSNIEIISAFPEYKVNLPGGKSASQNDIFVLARGNKKLITIMVEGKVNEPFDKNISEWKINMSNGKKERLDFLCKKIRCNIAKIDSIKYQLIHRTASAIIEAESFCAKNALLLIHSFSKEKIGFDDYCNFLLLYKINGEVSKIQGPVKINGIDLYFLWVTSTLKEKRGLK